MSRLVLIVMLTGGLFPSIECSRKSPDRPPGKAASQEVRRDVGQPVKAASEHPQQTKEEVRTNREIKPMERTPEKAAPQEVRRDAGQPAKTVSEYYKRTKQEYQKKLEAKINELETEIGKLRNKGEDLQGSAKADWDQKMAELDVKQDGARAKLDKIVYSKAAVWKDFQQEAEKAYDELEKAVRDLSKNSPDR